MKERSDLLGYEQLGTIHREREQRWRHSYRTSQSPQVLPGRNRLNESVWQEIESREGPGLRASWTVVRVSDVILREMETIRESKAFFIKHPLLCSRVIVI